MEQASSIGNRLLDALPQADFDLLAPNLRKVPLEPDAVLVRSGDRVEQIHFPCSGLIALVMDMPNGDAVATSIVGNEGVSGVLTSLGPVPSPITAVVLLGGSSWQIAPSQFRTALRRSAAVGHIVQVFAQALIAQLQHVASCNALHPVDTRLAGWLLRIHDCVEGDVLPVTQEALAELLGVRRPTVTQVVHKLKASQAIRSNWRGSIEVDRPRLEATACDCYKLMKRRIDGIMSEATFKPHNHAASGNRSSHRREFLSAKLGS
jgi:CRP-like cAMP-binding protein